MRAFILVLALILMACGNRTSNEGPPVAPVVDQPTTQTVSLDVPDFSIDSLPKVKQRAFRKILPDKTREFLETAPEFTVTMRERKFLLNDAIARKQLLNAIYWDVANSIHERDIGSEVACVEDSPRILVTRQNEHLMTENAGITLSYTCGKIQVYMDVFPFRKDMRTIDPFDGREARSKAVFDRLLEVENAKQ